MEVVVHIGRGQDLRLQSPPEVLPAYHYLTGAKHRTVTSSLPGFSMIHIH